MSRLSLPILTLGVRQQRYSCHGCGNCCRDFTVQLREADLAKLNAQQWVEKLGEPVTVAFRGTTFLRQRDDGACMFLMEDGLCRIHKEFGFAEKPIACQLFPFHLSPAAGGLGMGISFACQSVLENNGAELRSHNLELGRMAGVLEELHVKAAPPMLTDRLRASKAEEKALIEHIHRWLQSDIDLNTRVDGLAWIIGSLTQAKLENVREQRFADLLDVLFGALPEELQHHPLEPPTRRQLKLLRQGVFARTEDPKLNAIEARGRIRTMFSQLSRSRRFKSGHGIAPRIGTSWPENVRLERVADIAAARPLNQNESEITSLGVDPIDDLMTRYLRASILGRRCWGPGYYGWNILGGLQALLLNVACIGWLARLHAAGQSRDQIDINDVRAAIGRIDRTAGRAKWLGSAAERLRLAFLSMDDGLRRLIHANRLM